MYIETLLPIISGCLQTLKFDQGNVITSTAAYRPLYRAVYKPLQQRCYRSFNFIAHYIGLSTMMNKTNRSYIIFYRPLYRAVYVLFEDIDGNEFYLFIAHYIGLSTYKHEEIREHN